MKDKTIPSRKKTLKMVKAEIRKAENNKEVIEKFGEIRRDPSKHQQTAKSVDELRKNRKWSN